MGSQESLTKTTDTMRFVSQEILIKSLLSRNKPKSIQETAGGNKIKVVTLVLTLLIVLGAGNLTVEVGYAMSGQAFPVSAIDTKSTTSASPEFPSWTPLLVMLLIVTVFVYKQRTHYSNKGKN